MQIQIQHLVNFLNTFRFNAKFDVDAMYEECPFYAFVSEHEGMSLKSELNYETRTVSFELRVPDKFKIIGTFKKQGHPDFNEEQFALIEFVNRDVAGNFDRVDFDMIKLAYWINPDITDGKEQIIKMLSEAPHIGVC